MKERWKIAQGHLMTAISYMLPLIMGASLVLALAKLAGLSAGVTSLSVYAEKEGFFHFLYEMESVGWLGIGLMNCVFAGFLAYSIADKPGLAPGFIGGMLANNKEMGFIGALVAGAFAGWIVNLVKNKVHLGKTMDTLVPLVILPLISVGLTSILIAVVLDKPLNFLNTSLISWISDMCTNGTNFVFVAVILGGMIGFDLGGPVGKAAWVSCNALYMSGVYLPTTALNIAICIPPLGYGIATLIMKKRFDGTFKEAGKGAMVMGVIGITEGAIPFTLKNPLKLIPINVIACAAGSATVVLLGVYNEMPPIGGLYGFISLGNPWAYLIGGVVGAAIIVLGVLVTTKFTMADTEKVEVKETPAFDELAIEEL